MNAHHGTPTGTKGTVKFDGMPEPKNAVLRENGVIFVQSVNPHLWLPTTARAEQFTASA